MNERKRTPGFPWHLWAALLVVAALVYSGYQIFPPSFQLSPAEVTLRDGSCVAEFDVTNHARTSVTKIVRVTVFAAQPGGKLRKPLHMALDHRDISITVAASEKQRVHCEFTQTGATAPNLAEVETVSDAP